MSDSEYQTHFDRHRRSSILKPAKISDNRAPLQDLASSDDTTTTSTSIYKKRVSFAGIKIKEFSMHAQTKVVPQTPAYDDFLSSMSDSSHQNSDGSHCNFSPMVPACLVPENEENQNPDEYEFTEPNQILYSNQPAHYFQSFDQPFDLTTSSKYENHVPEDMQESLLSSERINDKNKVSYEFLESTKLSHCNTIMTTLNISGIQNLGETDVNCKENVPPCFDESNDEDSFQRMILSGIEEDSPNFVPCQKNTVNATQQENATFVAEQVNASCGVETTGMQQLQKKSFERAAVNQSISDDSMDFTSYFPIRSEEIMREPLPNVNESEMDITSVVPRKSIGPRKSMNAQKLFEKTCLNESQIRFTQTNINDSGMEFTSVLPRKLVGDHNGTVYDQHEMDVSKNKENVLEKIGTQEINMRNPEQINKTTFGPSSGKISRKSMGCNMKNKTFTESMDNSNVALTAPASEKSLRKSLGVDFSNLDESGMEITEAFNVIDSEVANLTQENRCKDIDVSMSDSVANKSNNSDMDITEQVTLNAPQVNYSMNMSPMKEKIEEEIGNLENSLLVKTGSVLSHIPIIMSPHKVESETGNFLVSKSMEISSLLQEKIDKQSEKSLVHEEVSSMEISCLITESVKLVENTLKTENKKYTCFQNRDEGNGSFQKMSLVETILDKSNRTSRNIQNKPPISSDFPNVNTSVLEKSTHVKEISMYKSSVEPDMGINQEMSLSMSSQNVTPKTGLTETTTPNEKLCFSDSGKIFTISGEFDHSKANKSVDKIMNISDLQTMSTDSGQSSMSSNHQLDTNVSSLNLSSKISGAHKGKQADCVVGMESINHFLNESKDNSSEVLNQDDILDESKNNSSRVLNQDDLSTTEDKNNLLEINEPVSVHEDIIKNIFDVSSITEPDDNENGSGKGNLEPSLVTKYEEVNISNNIQNLNIADSRVVHKSIASDSYHEKLPSENTHHTIDSCESIEFEKSRKRASDGYEAHEENVVDCGESNKMIANPKKRSKCFENKIFKEGNQVERIDPLSYSTSDAEIAVQQHISHIDNCAKENVQNISKTNQNESLNKTYGTNQLDFENKNNASDFHESQPSLNLSTYPNPSSTLTDTIINNMTDIEIPLMGSVRKTPIESKQQSFCSTPTAGKNIPEFLPNSCSKNVIVDKFFESMNKNFPGKNIVKKLNLITDNSRSSSDTEESSDIRSSPKTPANTPDASSSGSSTPSSFKSNGVIPKRTKRTKKDLNLTENTDMNSSNYIPEKVLKQNLETDEKANLMSKEQKMDNEIALLGMSHTEEFEQLNDIKICFDTSLNLDTLDRSKIMNKSSLEQDNLEFKVCETQFGKKLGETLQNHQINETKEPLNIAPRNEVDKNQQVFIVKNVDTNDDESLLAFETSHENEQNMSATKINQVTFVKDKVEHKTSFTNVSADAIIPEEIMESVQNKVNEADLMINTEQITINEDNDPNNKSIATIEPTHGHYARNAPEQIDTETKKLENTSEYRDSEAKIRKRLSRLSIVPKQNTSESCNPSLSMKRKTLKVVPKSSTFNSQAALASTDDSVQEMEDASQRMIREEEKKDAREWKIKTLEPQVWEFEFFYNLVVLKIEFIKSEKQGAKHKRVSSISFEFPSRMTELRRLCFQHLKNKYSKCTLKSMCVSSDDIIPLLEHVSSVMKYLKTFAQSIKSCMLLYGLQLEPDCQVTINILSYELMEWSKVSISMRNIDFITQADIKIKRIYGDITESGIRKLFPLLSIRDNPAFLENFIQNIYKRVKDEVERKKIGISIS